METKLSLCLLLIILGTIIVHGARLENQEEDSMNVYSERELETCGPPIGFCWSTALPCRHGTFDCSASFNCTNVRTRCCCYAA
ncbi:small cysteine-rich protein 1-like [Oculina patagonica]